jgi:predicted ABC-type transport system involved in lysophospholipase L1 biosynthesis ATPase subunit
MRLHGDNAPVTDAARPGADERSPARDRCGAAEAAAHRDPGRGVTVLVATHDRALIDLADRVLSLVDGRIATEA